MTNTSNSITAICYWSKTSLTHSIHLPESKTKEDAIVSAEAFFKKKENEFTGKIRKIEILNRGDCYYIYREIILIKYYYNTCGQTESNQ